MSAPELKQKKIARDQAIAKAEADAAAKAATAATEHTKAIVEKAKQYEAEYAKVGLSLHCDDRFISEQRLLTDRFSLAGRCFLRLAFSRCH